MQQFTETYHYYLYPESNYFSLYFQTSTFFFTELCTALHTAGNPNAFCLIHKMLFFIYSITHTHTHKIFNRKKYRFSFSNKPDVAGIDIGNKLTKWLMTIEYLCIYFFFGKVEKPPHHTTTARAYATLDDNARALMHPKCIRPINAHYCHI